MKKRKLYRYEQQLDRSFLNALVSVLIVILISVQYCVIGTDKSIGQNFGIHASLNVIV